MSGAGAVGVDFRALETALQCARQAIAERASHGAAWRIGNSLFWLCALDEGCTKRLEGYGDRRDADAGGSVVPGLRQLRNAVGHQLVTVTTAGLRAPLVAPLVIVERWATGLGEPRSGGARHQRMAEVYRSRLADEPTQVALTEALDWFERLHAASWDVSQVEDAPPLD